MTNVKQFKSKSEKFNEWLEAVKEINKFDTTPPESCLMMYTDKDGKAYSVYYQCGDDMIWKFSDDLKREALERKFDSYLKEHIGDYLEYVE